MSSNNLLYCLLLLIGCSGMEPPGLLVGGPGLGEGLSKATLESLASSEMLKAKTARVIVDNETAFEQKLRLIRSAKQSLELAYYIFQTDFSSSLLAQELISAANRGVDVRLLVDYHDSYKNLDWFLMMEKYGNSAKGSLQVRFYNRPTDYIIKDAVYLTLSCSDVGHAQDFNNCAKAKYQEIERRFEASRKMDNSFAPSNYNSGGSGLFLSALYSKNLDLLAHAVINGQQIDFSLLKDPGPTTEKEKRLENSPVESSTVESRGKKFAKTLAAAKVYWQTRASNDARLEKFRAKALLAFAFVLYGEKINPIYDMLTAHLPIGRRENAREAIRDWDYLTEFLHHKFLLSDSQKLMLGGRNIEDSYHMRKNSLTEKYVFMDTDVVVDLPVPAQELQDSYTRLWDFEQMVVDIDDVRLHAPNDFLVATTNAEEKCAKKFSDIEDARYQACYSTVFTEQYVTENRIEHAHYLMLKRAKLFSRKYRPRAKRNREQDFEVDSSAQIYYLENLPFRSSKTQGALERSYGAKNGREVEFGKRLHEVWLRGLEQACLQAQSGEQQEVLLHNAYFFLPSNLLAQLSKMVDGSMDCSNVRITVLTNSPESTDLNVINLASRYSLRAFSEYVEKNRDEKKGATLRYFDYLRRGTAESSEASLHSKVSILGSDIIVGSANADVRSYMMDTNNGVLIRNAPGLHAKYMSWIEKLLEDGSQTAERGRSFREASREDLLRRDKVLIRKLLNKLLMDAEGNTKIPVDPLVTAMSNVLNRIYELSVKIVKQQGGKSAAGRDFNSYFKLL